MEWMGWFTFIIILCYSSYPGKVKKLESKVKKLERAQRGMNDMSKILETLVGTTCNSKTEDALILVGAQDLRCTVLEVDDEWIKFSYTDKKQVTKTKIIRIDAIDSVELIEQ